MLHKLTAPKVAPPRMPLVSTFALAPLRFTNRPRRQTLAGSTDGHCAATATATAKPGDKSAPTIKPPQRGPERESKRRIRPHGVPSISRNVG